MLRPASSWICKKNKNALSSGYQDLMGHLILTTCLWSVLTWITLVYSVGTASFIVSVWWWSAIQSFKWTSIFCGDFEPYCHHTELACPRLRSFMQFQPEFLSASNAHYWGNPRDDCHVIVIFWFLLVLWPGTHEQGCPWFKKALFEPNFSIIKSKLAEKCQ